MTAWWAHSPTERLHSTDHSLSHKVYVTLSIPAGVMLCQSPVCELVLSLITKTWPQNLSVNVLDSYFPGVRLQWHLLPEALISVGLECLPLLCIIINLSDFAPQLILLDCSFLHYPSEFVFWPASWIIRPVAAQNLLSHQSFPSPGGSFLNLQWWLHSPSPAFTTPENEWGHPITYTKNTSKVVLNESLSYTKISLRKANPHFKLALDNL